MTLFLNCLQKLGSLQLGTNYICSNAAKSLQILGLASKVRGIQTSSVCLRRLDSHAYPPFKHPSKNSNRWEPRVMVYEEYEYTTKKIPYPATGGRGPNGRIWVHRKGGEGKRYFRMIDWVRGGNEDGTPIIEKVQNVHSVPMRSANIALVTAGEKKRYIIATQNMKPGDMIKSSTFLTRDTVKANEGDSYPLGCLPLGTFVNCVQGIPGEWGHHASAAGVSALLVRKQDDKVVVRLPSKREICVSATCTATVGRVSNIHHNKIVVGKAGRNRWKGIRPKSGKWHRKTGKDGRKAHPIKPMLMFDKPRVKKLDDTFFTFRDTSFRAHNVG